MNKSDRNHMAEAIGRLMDLCVKYKTPLSLDISFNDSEKGIVNLQFLGEKKDVEWYPKLGRFSHEFRALNIMCWLNSDSDTENK